MGSQEETAALRYTLGDSLGPASARGLVSLLGT